MYIIRAIIRRPLRRVIEVKTFASSGASKINDKWPSDSAHNPKHKNASFIHPESSVCQHLPNPYSRPNPEYKPPDVKKILEDYRCNSPEHLKARLVPVIYMTNGLHAHHHAKRLEFRKAQEEEKMMRKEMLMLNRTANLQNVNQKDREFNTTGEVDIKPKMPAARIKENSDVPLKKIP